MLVKTTNSLLLLTDLIRQIHMEYIWSVLDITTFISLLIRSLGWRVQNLFKTKFNHKNQTVTIRKFDVSYNYQSYRKKVSLVKVFVEVISNRVDFGFSVNWRIKGTTRNWISVQQWQRSRFIRQESLEHTEGDKTGNTIHHLNLWRVVSEICHQSFSTT